jgi:sec-independent protein translocase protein TatA
MRIGGLGFPELMIILTIVVLIFGVGKLSGIGAALGTSIKEFRDAISGEKRKEPPQESLGEGKAEGS